MKSLIAYWVAAMLVVAGIFGVCVYFQGAPITADPQLQLRTLSTELKLDNPRIETSSYFDAPWLTSLSGPSGIFGSTALLAEQVYVVRKGDELGKIARTFRLGGWGSLYRRNREVIGGNPDLVKPGQVLLIPVQSAIIPSRPSNIGKATLLTATSFKVCGICHVQKAQLEDSVDCSFCHNSQQVVTAATAQAKRLVTTRRAARSPKRIDGLAQWALENVDPFGERRDPIKAINLLPIDNALKTMLIDSYYQPSESFLMMPGQDIDFLLFGRYKWISTARWVGTYPLPGEAWPVVTYNGRSMRLVRTFACYNLEIIPVKLPVAPEAPRKDTPPDNVVTTSSPPDNVVTTPTTKPIPTPEPPPPPPVVEAPAKPRCTYGVDWEGNTFGGFRRGVSSDAWHYYDGVNFVIFPLDCRSGPNHWRIGFSGEVVAFEGDINENDPLTYDGYRQVYGVEVQAYTPTTKTVFDLRYGQKRVNVNTNGGYSAKEKVNLLNADLVHSDWNTGMAAIKMLQYGVHSDVDLGGRKSSNVNGVPFSADRDPRLDGSEFSIRARALGNEIGKTGLSPFMQLEAGYLPGPQIYALEPRVGLEVDDGWATLEAAYRANYQAGKQDDDTMGLSFNLSLDKIWKNFKNR